RVHNLAVPSAEPQGPSASRPAYRQGYGVCVGGVTVQISRDDQRFLRRKKKLDLPLTNAIRLVDLFSGCGGLTLGVAEACRDHARGFEVVLGMEINDKIRQIYDENF